jgi:putative solute:sodium symporter small subunit
MEHHDHYAHAYWRATKGLLIKVLIVWAVVSYGAGIFFAEWLNQFQIGGYPVGFWFAQQGSIYVFIFLIFWYRKKMNDIDRQFDVDEK